MALADARDPELSTTTSDDEAPTTGWKRTLLVAVAATAGLAAVATWGLSGRAAKGVAGPVRGFSLPEGALPEGVVGVVGVVGLSQGLATSQESDLTGTLSTGVDFQALSSDGYASELHGCCPLLGGQYLECCKLAGQCCPSPQGMLLSCCPQYRPPEPLKRCSGDLGKNVCPNEAECCNGLCCAEGATCCGQICCGKGSTCCKDKNGVHVCGAEGNACGGDFGGAPLHWSNWPNPATPKSWSKDSPEFGVTVFQAPPKTDGLERCHGENGRMVCLNNAQCCNGLCCGLEAQCCGNICCGKESTCCKNAAGSYYCGAPGNVCAEGSPIHERDWLNIGAPKDAPNLGATIFRVAPPPPSPAPAEGTTTV